MKKKQILGLIAAVVLFCAAGSVSVFTHKAAENLFTQGIQANAFITTEMSAPQEDYIAVVNVTGVIEEQQSDGFAAQGYQHNVTMDFIDELMTDENNKGILLYLDTPGGSVYESDELYLKLMEYKEITQKPVWSYMSHMAASGGYYAAMSSDKIFANRNTITGSIGVIISGVDMSGLYEKLGIKYYSATSGDYKDSSIMTDDQLAVLQSMVDESYEQFVDVVETGRNMSEEDVKNVADGRIYSAAQAKDLGLIDEITSLEQMQTEMSAQTGADIYYTPQPEQSFLGSLFAAADRIIPKSEAQVLTELKDEQKNGRLMYYAEQLK